MGAMFCGMDGLGGIGEICFRRSCLTQQNSSKHIEQHIHGQQKIPTHVINHFGGSKPTGMKNS